MLSPFDPAVQPVHATPDHRVVIVHAVDPLAVRDGIEGEPVLARDALPGWRLAVGDRALAVRVGSELIVTHALTKRPTRGVVAAVAGQVATVTADAQPWDLGFLGSAPAVGATVRILWDADGGTVLGAVGAATAAPSNPVDDHGGGTAAATLNLRPIGYATYRSGQRDTGESTVAQGYYPGWAHLGAKSGLWVYGDVWGGVKGRTCTRLRIQIARHSGMGTYAARTAWFWRHTNRTLPTGDPSWVGSVHGGIQIAAGASGTFDLPAAWGTDLAAAGGGVGIRHDGSADYMGLTGGTLTATFA